MVISLMVKRLACPDPYNDELYPLCSYRNTFLNKRSGEFPHFSYPVKGGGVIALPAQGDTITPPLSSAGR